MNNIRTFAELFEDLAFAAQAPHGVAPSSAEVRALDRRLKKLDRRYMNINYGGCGAFAVALYDAIVSEFGVTPEIYAEFRNDRDADRQAIYVPKFKNLTQLNNADIFMRHVVLVLDNYVMDSEGVRPKSKETWRGAETHRVGIDLLRQWVDDAEEWNPTFDRNDIVPLTYEVSKALQQVGKLCVKHHLSDEQAKAAAKEAIGKSK